MDAYAVLGLRPGATKDQIKARYRELARLWHPDRNKTAGAGAKMQEINRAYESLMSGRVRSAADQDGKTPYEKWYRDQQAGKRQGFKEEKWQDPFGFQHPFTDEWAKNIKKEFEKYQYTDAWASGTHTNARPMKKCPHCNGSGEIPA